MQGWRKRATVVLLLALVIAAASFWSFWQKSLPPQQAYLEQPGEKQGEKGEDGVITIYISGAVQRPGVYTLPAGRRLYHLVKAAGGLRADAAQGEINLAQPIKDGMHLHIPARNGEMSQAGSGGTRSRISINSADAATLCTLPGVSPLLARRIIDHRQKEGGFSTLESLKKVQGLGGSRWEKIKELITL